MKYTTATTASGRLTSAKMTRKARAPISSSAAGFGTSSAASDHETTQLEGNCVLRDTHTSGCGDAAE